MERDLAPEKEPLSSIQNSQEPLGLLRTLAVVSSGVLFGLLLSKLRTPNEDSHDSVSPNNTSKEEHRAVQIGSVVVPQFPPTSTEQQQTKGRANDRPAWEKCAAIAVAAGTIGLLGVNAYQTYLLREQLVGSQAPIFEFRAALGKPYFSISAYNWGHMAARHLRMKTILVQKTVDGGEQVGEPFSFTEEIPLVAAQEHAIRKLERRLPKIDYEAIASVKNYAQVDIIYSYEDGFGNTVSGDECFVYVGTAGLGLQPPRSCVELPLAISEARAALANQKN